MSKVAFLGTGLLGSAMAEGMLGRGETVTVWNRTASKAQALAPLGATVAATPAEAVRGADRVHMTLSDDASVDALLAGMVDYLASGAVIVDHTTTSPRGTVDRYARMHERGVKFLHVPVFMSPDMARNAQGMIMTSGPEAVFAEVRAPLERLSSEAWYLGDDPGRAAAFKLFGNSMFFVITAGLADVFAMARNIGLPPADAMQVFTKLQPGATIKYRGEKMARGDFTATFELTMARKDVQLMLDAAGDEPTVVLPAIAQRMDEVIANGHGQDDLGAIMRVD